MLCLCPWHTTAVKFNKDLLNITEVWLKKMMSRMWKIAIMVLLCVLWISNLEGWGMSVGEEQEEIAVFSRQRKLKIGFRENHPNYEAMSDPLAQVTVGCCWLFSHGLHGCQSLHQARLLPFTGDSQWLKSSGMVPRGETRAQVCPPVCGHHYRLIVWFSLWPGYGAFWASQLNSRAGHGGSLTRNVPTACGRDGIEEL